MNKKSQPAIKRLESDATSFCIMGSVNIPLIQEGNKCTKGMLAVKKEKGDIIIYGCVIVGAGIGVIINHTLPAVLVGLGAGYLIKYALYKE